MDVGIGLPNTIPGTDGRLVVEWARRADGGPFSTLGVLDRLAYDSIDPFAALAAAARLTRPLGPGTPAALGSGLLRARRRGPGRRLLARLLRLHGPVRRADRRRQPHLRPRDPRLRARLRGGRLRRADPVPDGRGHGVARAPGRGAGVRVRIIGAGPAGLYLAILLKKADRTHDVAVVERNPPDATFGWGVVFSEETLGPLRDADPESHLQI